MQALKASLNKLLDPDEDQIRIYPLSADSARALEILGRRRLEEREDFWIV